jgi:hypothetical protein
MVLGRARASMDAEIGLIMASVADIFGKGDDVHSAKLAALDYEENAACPVST